MAMNMKKMTSIEKMRLDYDRKLVIESAKEQKNNHLPNREGSYVCFNHIEKVYPNGYHAVKDFDFDIKKGEFIVFVGPSGCGKTTTLRMVCGLEEISSGALYINGVYSNDLEPKDRGVSMVFQNYALFPHLTVFENMAYGLKIKKILAPKLDENGNQVVGIDVDAIKRLEKEKKWYLKNDPSNEEALSQIDHDINLYKTTEIPLNIKRKLTKNEIKEKVNKAAEILNLSELLDRKPGQLSGGQCQRVALGRVIVSDAKLLLMDEPLSNLDAKLRVSMRGEIINLHKTLGATTIYVTHDQVEAMTMSDRLVVMDRACIKQIGTPTEVYEHPNCLFVATFIGSPNMNILNATLSSDGHIKSSTIDIDNINGLDVLVNEFYKKLLTEKLEDYKNADKRFNVDVLIEDERKRIDDEIQKLNAVISTKAYPLKFGIRPEDIRIASSNSAIKFAGKILSYELLGEQYLATISVGDNHMLVKLPNTYNCVIGGDIELTFNKDKAHLFDCISGKAFF